MKTELGERTRRFVSSAFAWLFPCVIIVLAVFDDNRILGSALLLTLLNGVFLTAVSLFTATLAFIGYIRVGAWRLLILSAGSVIFGLTPLLSALVMDSFGANVSVTIYNTGALLTAICFTLVIIKFSWTTAIDENPGRRMAAAAITLFLTISVTGLIAYLSMERILPPFFIQGYGSTPIREVTLGLVIVLFGYVGLQVYRDYQDSKSSFNYWFAIGLFCADRKSVV